MRSKGFRFTLGVWGESCVRQTLPNRPQPSATVRSHSREVAIAVPLVSSAKGVSFGAFQRRIASFRVAGVALCDIPTCFTTCQKSFCVAGAIRLRGFQKIHCIFHVASAALWRPPMSFLRGRHSTFRRVVLPMFCESQCQGCTTW